MPPANVEGKEGSNGWKNRRRERGKSDPLLSSRAGGGIYSSQGKDRKKEKEQEEMVEFTASV